MTSRVLVLHLSDIHVKDAKHPSLNKFTKIRDRLRDYTAGKERLVVILSGDLAYSGHKEEYSLLKRGLQDLVGEIELPVSWVPVPGNHDGAFKEAPKNRKHVIQGVILDGESGIDESVIETCVAPQSEYFDFEEELVGTTSYA